MGSLPQASHDKNLILAHSSWQSWCNWVRFVGHLARTCFFSYAHKLSIGLKSRRCDGHSNTLTWLSLSHFSTTLEVCLMLPPPCLTVGMVFFSLQASPFSSKHIDGHYGQIVLFLSDQRTFLQKLRSLSPCAVANRSLAFLWLLPPDNLNDPRQFGKVIKSMSGNSNINELPSCVLKDSVAVYDKTEMSTLYHLVGCFIQCPLSLYIPVWMTQWELDKLLASCHSQGRWYIKHWNP